MQRTDFEIGFEFECGGRRWRCTDIGTRTVIAIALEYPDDPSWYNGPPYAVAEAVFDEYDLEGCKPVEDDPEIRRNLKAVENAVSQQRLEGLAGPPEVVADMERAARGEIGIEEGIQNTREKFRQDQL
ncbi:MAG: antitoxin VbhA family protein [Candidatus Competibacteraceae bacterium]